MSTQDAGFAEQAPFQMSPEMEGAVEQVLKRLSHASPTSEFQEFQGLPPKLATSLASQLLDGYAGTTPEADQATVVIAEALARDALNKEPSLDALSRASALLERLGSEHFVRSMIAGVKASEDRSTAWRAVLCAAPPDASQWVDIPFRDVPLRAGTDTIPDDAPIRHLLSSAILMQLRIGSVVDPVGTLEMLARIKSTEIARAACWAILGALGFDPLSTATPAACGLLLSVMARVFAEEADTAAFEEKHLSIMRALVRRDDAEKFVGCWLAYLAARLTRHYVGPSRMMTTLEKAARVVAAGRLQVSFREEEGASAFRARAILLDVGNLDGERAVQAATIWREWIAYLDSCSVDDLLVDDLTAELMGWVLGQTHAWGDIWRETTVRLARRMRQYEWNPYTAVDVARLIVIGAARAAKEQGDSQGVLVQHVLDAAVRRYCVVDGAGWRDADVSLKHILDVIRQYYRTNPSIWDAVSRRLPTATLISESEGRG